MTAMTISGAATSYRPAAVRPPAAAGQLRGGRLIAARVAWLLLSGGAIAFFAMGVSPRYSSLRGQYQGTLHLFLNTDNAGIVNVTPLGGGPAVQAGILSGDILVAVNGKPVRPVMPGASLDNVLPAGVAGDPVTLEVRTGDAPTRRYRLPFSGPMVYGLGLPGELVAGFSVGFDCVTLLMVTAIALVIFRRRSRDWPALLASATMVSLYAIVSFPADAAYAANPTWQPVFDAWGVVSQLALCLFFYLFPNGQWVPRWSRVPVGILTICTLVMGFAPLFLSPGPPIWVHWAITVGWLCGGAAQVVRFRRHATASERRQIAWVAAGACTAFLGVMLLTLLETGSSPWLASTIPATLPFGPLSPVQHLLIPTDAAALPYDLLFYPLGRLLILLLPLSIAVAILRYRLWDIEVIVNRALLYAGLTASVVGLYSLGVTLAGATFRTGNNAVISAAITCVIALLFQPLRARLQRGVDRLMFGERDNPYGVLARLDQRLALALPPESVLPTIVETVATALKLSYAAVTLVHRGSLPADGAGNLPTNRGEQLVASHGTPTLDAIRLPLVYGAETVGYLHLAPRPGEAGFTPADRRLLDDLAGHAGVVVHAVRLTADLRRARERMVSAREEERRRLRRDLHDGLGSQLASLTLTLGAARAYLARDPASADALLGTLAGHVQSAIADVRRLVYELRPPALDDLGLVGALHDQAARYSAGTLQVRVEAPTSLPALPAAVEIAAYRICLEGMTNVVRHAQARTCVIRLCLAPELLVEILDDGVGIPATRRTGVGLRSLHERAEELGGSCVIERAPQGGTRVAAWLPLGEE